MNNLSGSGVTNSLLALIAVLMLVSVVQNASRPGMPMGAAPAVSGNPHAGMGQPSGFHSNDGSNGVAEAPQDFNPTDMIYAALKCPSNVSLSLNEPGCQGAEAAKYKKVVDESYGQGLPIPKIFDAVIEKFGEKALTDQAMEIRRSRRAK